VWKAVPKSRGKKWPRAINEQKKGKKLTNGVGRSSTRDDWKTVQIPSKWGEPKRRIVTKKKRAPADNAKTRSIVNTGQCGGKGVDGNE